MAKRVSITEDTLDYLRQAASTNTSLPEMAQRVGCCIDTLKRILMRHNILEFRGAKYIPSRRQKTEFWTRRCLCCRNEVRIPRNKYLCLDCKKHHGVANGDLEDAIAAT